MRGGDLDVDGNECGVSLGDTNDRAGAATALEEDFGPFGAECRGFNEWKSSMIHGSC